MRTAVGRAPPILDRSILTSDRMLRSSWELPTRTSTVTAVTGPPSGRSDKRKLAMDELLTEGEGLSRYMDASEPEL